ncbi:MAG: CTP-dependent riboflavin kinase [Colwellia sp.]|jgi:CTP-dependent riboflavin kinase
MRSEKEVKYMETVKAVLDQVEDNYSINININDEIISIPISETNANVVKSSFNTLMRHLKKGEFSIELEGTYSGLFYHVAVEYIEQLNKELSEIFTEMNQYGFIDVLAEDL